MGERERSRKLLEHVEQRSLYAQAIFTTEAPGRAELTREVTNHFRPRSTVWRMCVALTSRSKVAR